MQNVFINRILNMKHIRYIGLDMDHTLVRYQTKNFETLVYQMVLKHLVSYKDYPEGILQLTFDFDKAIRGLVLDSHNGNILKLSRYGAIRQSFHGTEKIPFSEQKKFYRTTYVDLNDPNYFAVDTSFSIAFCVLYGQIIDYKDQHNSKMPSYNMIAQDLLETVNEVHMNGRLKQLIAQKPEKYIIQDEKVVAGIKRYIKYNKKFFILTNSDYTYAKTLLDYAINPFLEKGEHWKDLFEIVITSANKPHFFYEEEPFLTIDAKSGKMDSLIGSIQPGIYHGGHATQFTEDLKLQEDEILYIGDHIYGDILRLKKDCNWRTALVLEELGEEVASQHSAKPIEDEIAEKMNVKRALEKESVHYQTKAFEESTSEYDALMQGLQEKITSLDNQITSLIHKQHTYYNATWGRIFRTGAEESYFAYQVDRFACIYMEKLSDLLEHSPLTYFRSYRRLLAHDIDVY